MARFQGKSNRKKVTFDGFSTANGGKGKLVATAYKNCDCRGGILRPGVGVKPYLTADGSRIYIAANNVDNIFSVRFQANATEAQTENFMVVLSDGALCEVNATGRTEVRAQFGTPFSHQAVKTENGKIVNMFSCPQRAACAKNVTTYSDCATGEVLGCCIVGGRSFIGLGSRIIQYSKPHAIDDFGVATDGGGKLYLPDGDGEIISLQTDGECLYVFLEKAIFRVKVRADGMDFVMEEVTYAGGEICAHSMAIQDGGIVFLSVSGVYFLQGKKAEPICVDLSIRPVDAKYVCGVGYCEELVLIDYQALDEDGYKVVYRVAISPREKAGFFCERNGTLGGNDLCVIAGVVYQFVKGAENTVYTHMPQFEAGRLDFGTRAKKYLKRLCIQGRGDVEVLVQGDGKSIRYFFELYNAMDDARLISSGKEFVLRIYPALGAEVRSLQIEYVCMEEGYGN